MTYQLLYTKPGTRNPREAPWGQPHSEHGTLAAAIDASGHPADHWYSVVSCPDRLYVDWTQYFDPNRDYEDDEAHLEFRWVIEATGVAGELTDLLTSTVHTGPT